MRAGDDWGMKGREQVPALNLPILGICCLPLLPHFQEPLIFDVSPNKKEPKSGVWRVLNPFVTAVKEG